MATGLALGLLFASETPGGAQDSEDGEQELDPRFDEPFGSPQYLIHLTGTFTMSGFVEKDSYMLYHTPPDAEGQFLTADGFGGTFTNTGDLVGGPFSTPREVCAAAGGLPVSGFSAWNSNYYFDCATAAATGGDGSGGGINPAWIAAGGLAAAGAAAGGVAAARRRGRSASSQGGVGSKLGLIVPSTVSPGPRPGSLRPPREGVEEGMPEAWPPEPEPPEPGLPPDVDPCADMARLFNQASQLARTIRSERNRLNVEFETQKRVWEQLSAAEHGLRELKSQIDWRIISARGTNLVTLSTYLTGIGSAFSKVGRKLALLLVPGAIGLDELQTRYGTSVLTAPAAMELAAELQSTYQELGAAYRLKAKEFNTRQDQLDERLRKLETLVDDYAGAHREYLTSKYLCAHHPNTSLESVVSRPQKAPEDLPSPSNIGATKFFRKRAQESYP